jgi:hypothetical protein
MGGGERERESEREREEEEVGRIFQFGGERAYRGATISNRHCVTSHAGKPECRYGDCKYPPPHFEPRYKEFL